MLARHDVLAGAHRREQVVARGLDPADQLDDQLGAREDLLEARRCVRVSTPLITGRRPVAARDLVGALGEQLVERRADGAVTEQADAERGACPPRRSAR